MMQILLFILLAWSATFANLFGYVESRGGEIELEKGK